MQHESRSDKKPDEIVPSAPTSEARHTVRRRREKEQRRRFSQETESVDGMSRLDSTMKVCGKNMWSTIP
jgi:hypothetical protein